LVAKATIFCSESGAGWPANTILNIFGAFFLQECVSGVGGESESEDEHSLIYDRGQPGSGPQYAGGGCGCLIAFVNAIEADVLLWAEDRRMKRLPRVQTPSNCPTSAIAAPAETVPTACMALQL
jgi:hypothetical protein